MIPAFTFTEMMMMSQKNRSHWIMRTVLRNFIPGMPFSYKLFMLIKIFSCRILPDHVVYNFDANIDIKLQFETNCLK